MPAGKICRGSFQIFSGRCPGTIKKIDKKTALKIADMRFEIRNRYLTNKAFNNLLT